MLTNKEQYLHKLTKIKDDLPKAQYDKAEKLLKSIPDRQTLVHGDCHFKNILVQNDELLLIDMETLSIGHPIFELASLYCAYVGYSEFNKQEALDFFGLPADQTLRLYNVLINLYFGKEDASIKDKIALVGYVNICRWYKVHAPEEKAVFAKYIKRLISLLDKYDDLDVGI